MRWAPTFALTEAHTPQRILLCTAGIPTSVPELRIELRAARYEGAALPLSDTGVSVPVFSDPNRTCLAGRVPEGLASALCRSRESNPRYSALQERCSTTEQHRQVPFVAIRLRGIVTGFLRIFPMLSATYNPRARAENGDRTRDLFVGNETFCQIELPPHIRMSQGVSTRSCWLLTLYSDHFEAFRLMRLRTSRPSE